MGAALCFEEEIHSAIFPAWRWDQILFRLLAVRSNLSQSEEYLSGAEVRIQREEIFAVPAQAPQFLDRSLVLVSSVVDSILMYFVGVLRRSVSCADITDIARPVCGSCRYDALNVELSWTFLSHLEPNCDSCIHFGYDCHLAVPQRTTGAHAKQHGKICKISLGHWGGSNAFWREMRGWREGRFRFVPNVLHSVEMIFSCKCNTAVTRPDLTCVIMQILMKTYEEYIRVL